MKILQVNCVYKQGSTGKIIFDIHNYLQKERIDSVVCYGRGEIVNEQNLYKTCSEFYSKINNLWSRITGIMYGGLTYSTNKLKCIIENEKPDIVHLHCINGNFVNIYDLISYLKSKHIKTVLTLHAEFMYTANCGHALECEKWKTGCGKCPRLYQATNSIFLDNTHLSWKKMKDSFEGFGDDLVVTSVSPWLMERAKQSPILKDKKHFIVLNGLDTQVFKYRDVAKMRHDLGISTSEKVIFHATPVFSPDSSHHKGGYYVIELAKQMPDVKFIIAGKPTNRNIILPSNIVLLGLIKDQQYLASLYSLADLTVITSKKETFSMVCAESLCCGTPVVGFKAGAPELISLPEYSEFVEQANFNALKSTVLNFLSTKYDKISICATAHNNYAKEIMALHYINIYNKILS